MSSKIFVCGATGTQGGATTRHLLNKNITVHALARSPSSPQAQALKDLGVKFWPGSFSDTEALKSAIEGTQAVFMNFMPDFADIDGNLREAESILLIAKDAGVQRVVYSSGIGINRQQEFEHYDPNSMLAAILMSKLNIENAVKKSGLSWTILRPGNFMANYVNPFAQYQVAGLADTGRWKTALKETTPIPLVHTDTIGLVSATALLEPARFKEVELTYADEMTSMGDIIAKLATATGRDLQMVAMPEEDVMAQKSTNPFVAGQLSMRSMSKFISMEEFKTWGFPTRTFEEYLQKEKDAVDKTYLQQ